MAEPMYRQIADDLRREIESGGLALGSQLPSEADLREQYDASRNTVRDAIKLLICLGLIETRPVQGTFVVEKISPFITALTGDPHTGLGGGEGGVYLAEVAASRRTPGVSVPRVELHSADKVLARNLKINEGAQVVSRHQQRFIDGTPWSLQTSFYPMTFVEMGATKLMEATDIQSGTVAYLAAKCGIKQVGYRDSIAVRQPDENETAFFKLPGDGRVSVFDIFRVGFDEAGERIRLTITVYPTDRNRLAINAGYVPPRGADSI